ncbi:YkgJ family cysteine cluster protein [Magnetospirillum fulvum]|uniref:Putative zinc-or iron-chelating domain-containing protein n=1 Tax=Magnetospirillum fulvum TaxID=1082 RepID=A0A1H6GQR1_MAGFU|nr:YkgJ family cysteine cluster protein [Magnetospirillum fulvum]SEH25641.1 Putative zinc-or iron-chelating domain-containing protein [Magnetospirillum fulvum]
MERRFACTACGKCCYGLLPLTLDDALAHAGRFPLGVMLTPVRPGHKSFDLTLRLGSAVRLPNRRQIAVRISPVSYLPPTLACPELAADGLCAIHRDKPVRCRTMPFFAARDERDQSALLIPRSGWACDVSATAPVVYRDGAIVARDDFEIEARAMRDQAPILRAYAGALVATVPGVVEKLTAAAAKPVGGELLVGFSTLLRRLDSVDRAEIAALQVPVLADFAARTGSDPGLAGFTGQYRAWEQEMTRLARRGGTGT